MFYLNGERYSGDWKEDIREGHGTLFKSDDTIIQGSFSNDRPHGNCKYYIPSKRRKYEGVWLEGVPKCGEYTEYRGPFPLLKRTLDGYVEYVEEIVPTTGVEGAAAPRVEEQEDGKEIEENEDEGDEGESNEGESSSSFAPSSSPSSSSSSSSTPPEDGSLVKKIRKVYILPPIQILQLRDPNMVLDNALRERRLEYLSKHFPGIDLEKALKEMEEGTFDPNAYKAGISVFLIFVIIFVII
jgi:hypothetical protein